MPCRECLLVELPVTGYQEAWKLQKDMVAARKEGIIDRDILILLEHYPVFTLGRRGGINNLTVSVDFLEKKGIPLLRVERGGDITYHCPGQLVMYPIIDLRQARLGVAEYTMKLEEVMLRTAADSGIRAERNRMNRGIWVGGKKMGSIGIAIRHGISFHGISLNVNPDLEPLSWINPCGLKGIRMTSMEQETSHPLSMAEVRESMKRHAASIFVYSLEQTDPGKLDAPRIMAVSR